MTHLLMNQWRGDAGHYRQHFTLWPHVGMVDNLDSNSSALWAWGFKSLCGYQFMDIMDTQNTTNYDAGKIAKREAMRKELKRMKMQHMIELNQTISEKADVVAKRWIAELKQK